MTRYKLKQIGRFVLIVDAHFDDSPLYRYEATEDGYEQAERKCAAMNDFFEQREAA